MTLARDHRRPRGPAGRRREKRERKGAIVRERWTRGIREACALLNAAHARHVAAMSPADRAAHLERERHQNELIPLRSGCKACGKPFEPYAWGRSYGRVAMLPRHVAENAQCDPCHTRMQHRWFAREFASALAALVRKKGS